MKQQPSIGRVFLDEMSHLYEIDILSVLLQLRVARAEKKLVLHLMQEVEELPETWEHEGDTYAIAVEVKKKS